MLYGDSLEMLRRWDELADGSNGPNVNKDDFIRLQKDEYDIRAMFLAMLIFDIFQIT